LFFRAVVAPGVVVVVVVVAVVVVVVPWGSWRVDGWQAAAAAVVRWLGRAGGGG